MNEKNKKNPVQNRLYIIFYGGFYIIFVNFLTPPDISTKSSIIKSLFLATLMGIYFPGLICCQFYIINKLEKELGKPKDKLYSQSHKDDC